MGDGRATVFQVGSRQASATLDGEAIILGLDSGEYFGLAGVGRTVWEELQQPRSVADLESTILQAYDVSEATCRADLQRFLATLEAEGLIVRVSP